MTLESAAMLWKKIWLRRKEGARAGPEGAAMEERLLRAAKAGDTTAVLSALALGANIEARDAIGLTPLMAALRSGMPGARLAARALVESGADVGAATAAGDTALHWAACVDDDDSCQLLVEHGAREGVLNDEGEWPLEVAARMGSESCARLLWSAGSIEARTRSKNWADKLGHPMAGWMGALIEAEALSGESKEGKGSAARRL